MNAEPDSSPGSKDDRLLAELLAPLQGIEPPLESRITNRRAISAALSSLSAAAPYVNLPWWRRSISIPMPLAAALVLAVAALVFSQIRARRHQLPDSTNSPAPIAVVPAAKTSAVDAPPAVKHFETETYLCGVGRVSSESYFAIQE